jgi:pimeloyl-ACP methyl ester carboxylesterase
MYRFAAWAFLALFYTAAQAQVAAKPDTSPHKVQFITVDKGVTLEVLDWGGTGPPLVFLTGLGDTAHVFDSFAPKFTDHHHVYGITRRGIGLSSVPPPTDQNYDADRLGDDVLAVMDALKLDHPILAGHSIAGQELSSIGTRDPEKVAGLIYLDAANAYAFYDPAGSTLQVDVPTIRRDLEQLPEAGGSPSLSIKLMDEIEATIPSLRKAFAEYRSRLVGLHELPPRPQTLQLQVQDAITNNARRYTDIKPPILAIIAVPQQCAPNCDTPGAKAAATSQTEQANAFEAGNPSAHIVRLAYANHYVFRSNESEVVREMTAFMDGLPNH